MEPDNTWVLPLKKHLFKDISKRTLEELFFTTVRVKIFNGPTGSPRGTPPVRSDNKIGVRVSSVLLPSYIFREHFSRP